ncbi:MAG: hypothetical protein ACREBW_04055, partial [Candidatus Micrarchaeaceae archaeon]
SSDPGASPTIMIRAFAGPSGRTWIGILGLFNYFFWLEPKAFAETFRCFNCSFWRVRWAFL